MLQKPRPDVVHATPPPSHFGLVMDSFDAGAHVIVEKPATSTFEELETVIRRAEAGSRTYGPAAPRGAGR
jgi:predicted dehydrogenase